MAFHGTPVRVSLFLAWALFFGFPASASDLDSETVHVEFYYESLCPYCASFLVNNLSKLFRNGLISIVDLKLYPSGNVQIKDNDTIVCQHGPSECLLNTIEACAIHAWPDTNKHFPFIYCVEGLALQRKDDEWESCFSKLSLDPQPVLNCRDSGYGKQLQIQHAAKTAALDPPHQYVPWMTVNGKPLYEDDANFISYICKAYKGTAIHAACSELSLETIRTGRGKRSRVHVAKPSVSLSKILAMEYSAHRAAII